MNKIVASILAMLIVCSVAGCYVVDPYYGGRQGEREYDRDRGYERDRDRDEDHEREHERRERWDRDR